MDTLYYNSTAYFSPTTMKDGKYNPNLVKGRHSGMKFLLRDLLKERPQLLNLELVSQRGPANKKQTSAKQ